MTAKIETARRKARDIALKNGAISAPIPVDRIARNLGAVVQFSPMDDELSGLIFEKDGVPIIGVNALHHPHRQRFTIAHEIGHLVLHRPMFSMKVHVDKGFPVLRRDAHASEGTDLVEIEANEFAGELLVPAALLSHALDTADWDVDEEPAKALAKVFRVSPAMMQLRLIRLTKRG